MPATLIPPARLSDFLSTLRIRRMGSCSARTSSLPSTFPGQTWFRHKHAVSTLGVTSSGSMYLKTPQGYRTRTDSSQPGVRKKTKTTDRTYATRVSVHNVRVDASTRCRDEGVLSYPGTRGDGKLGYQ